MPEHRGTATEGISRRRRSQENLRWENSAFPVSSKKKLRTHHMLGDESEVGGQAPMVS